jgi:saccharopine dehydrogenase (NAD+, L-lysine forming)
MRVLVVGAGGVGGAVAAIATRRSFHEAMVVADYDLPRAQAVVGRTADPRFTAA